MTTRNIQNEKLTRRGFIRNAALGAAAVGGAGILSGCQAPAASNLPEKWDQEADVVVVGCGGAGAATAIEAARADAKVLVLERTPTGGGSTALCGGIIYLGGGTSMQKACGIDDTLDNMYNYMLTAAGDGADPEMVRTYVDENHALWEWLLELGVPFKENYLPGKFAAPPTDDGLVYSGNEQQAKYAAAATPVPRGHHVQAAGESGHALWPPLIAGIEAAGAEVLYETLAKELVVDADGRVVGVLADVQGEDQYIKAGKAVALCAGGFFANKEMVAQHCPEFLHSVYQVGTPGDDGSGIMMGQSAGGDVRMMGQGFAYSAPYLYGEAMVKGIMVDTNGRRFIGEDNYGSGLAKAWFATIT